MNWDAVSRDNSSSSAILPISIEENSNRDIFDSEGNDEIRDLLCRTSIIVKVEWFGKTRHLV